MNTEPGPQGDPHPLEQLAVQRPALVLAGVAVGVAAAAYAAGATAHLTFKLFARGWRVLR